MDRQLLGGLLVPEANGTGNILLHFRVNALSYLENMEQID